MRTNLPPAEHADVIESLCQLAIGGMCACGAEKGLLRYPFCPGCCNVLARANMGRAVDFVHFSLRQAGRTFEWQLFEQCYEVLTAIRAGKFDGKARRRSLEHSEEWN